MRPRIMLIAVLAGLLALPALAQSQSQPSQSRPAEPETAEPQPAEESPEPEHIKVQHILISFQGRLGGKVTRTQEEAKQLAYELLERARNGEDFDQLSKEFSDDRPPGIYAMANHGVRPRPGEYQRRGMVPAFGDVGFPLKVGEIGIADFHARNSPYGWHIVKRLE